MTAFIHILITNFAVKFDNFHIPTGVMLFAKGPFTVDAVGEFAAKTRAQKQLDLIDMPSASDLKQMFKFVGCEQF